MGSDRPALQKFAGIMSYLTLWNQLTQGLYFLFALMTDLKVRGDVSQGWKWLHHSSGEADTYLDRNLSDSSKALVSHRDRFFTLVWVTGNMVGIGYWGLLFPHAAVRADFLASDRHIIMCLLQHGFTWVWINTEMFSTNHRYKNWVLECGIVVMYGAAYLGWNLLVHAETGAWAYPSIQAHHSMVFNIIFYAGLFAVFICIYFVGRLVSRTYWSYKTRARRRSEGEASLLAIDVEAPRWNSAEDEESSKLVLGTNDPFA